MLSVSDHTTASKGAPVSMLTREDDVDAHALRKRGWTISAIARHLGHDRKTIRAYLSGNRSAGVREHVEVNVFDRYEAYVRARLLEDPHVWASVLFDEIVALGFDRSYPVFTHQVRTRSLRPHCEPCAPAKHRPVAVIEHPPGVETQWDWVDLPDPPPSWGWDGPARLFVGALAHSGKWRAVLAESMDQPHVIDGLDRVSRALGGVTNEWRFDRMATVCHRATGRITASFAAVAKHYGVAVRICPPRHGNRKGVVEKANHTAAQAWWRTLSDDVTLEAAQASLERFCAGRRGDGRSRVIGEVRATVAVHAASERLRTMPAPFPATITVERRVNAQALVSFRGNRYSVPPELAHTTVSVTRLLHQAHINIATPAGIVIARHALAADGTGVMVRHHGHVIALEHAALAAFNDGPPHRRKQRIPPGPAAIAAAKEIISTQTISEQTISTPITPNNPGPGRRAAGDDVVVDLAAYARAAHGRNTLT